MKINLRKLSQLTAILTISLFASIAKSDDARFLSAEQISNMANTLFKADGKDIAEYLKNFTLEKTQTIEAAANNEILSLEMQYLFACLLSRGPALTEMISSELLTSVSSQIENREKHLKKSGMMYEHYLIHVNVFAARNEIVRSADYSAIIQEAKKKLEMTKQALEKFEQIVKLEKKCIDWLKIIRKMHEKGMPTTRVAEQLEEVRQEILAIHAKSNSTSLAARVAGALIGQCFMTEATNLTDAHLEAITPLFISFATGS